MPRLVRMYMLNVAIGFGLSAVFTALLLWLDVARLGHLVSHTSEGWIAALMLFVFNGIVFAGVQFAIAVMRMEEKEPRGGKPLRLEPVTIPVRSGRG